MHVLAEESNAFGQSLAVSSSQRDGRLCAPIFEVDKAKSNMIIAVISRLRIEVFSTLNILFSSEAYSGSGPA